jgi:hypothetical protein
MAKPMNNKLSLSQKLLPGVIALFILFIYYSIKSNPGEFISWFGQTLIFNAAWFFLLKAIITMIVDREFEIKFIFPMLLGILALIVTVVAFKITPENIFVQFLEATALYSVLITIYGLLRDKIHEKL